MSKQQYFFNWLEHFINAKQSAVKNDDGLSVQSWKVLSCDYRKGIFLIDP